MIYNPFLKQIMEVVGVTDLTVMQERELQGLINDYVHNVSDSNSASYADGYDEGYKDAKREHEDDYDNGMEDGAKEFKDYILTHLEQQEVTDEILTEETIKKFAEYIEDLYTSY